MTLLRGLMILNEDARPMVYGPAELADIARHVRWMAPPQTRLMIENRYDLLSDVEVIFGGWGGPRLDHRFLSAAPRLKALFHAAGSLSATLTQAVWDRDIIITSAIEANAVPVAEYTLATILFSLKHGFRFAHELRQRRTYNASDRDVAPGAYGSTVGLISLGTVARKLLAMLKRFDLNLLVYDPFLSAAAASDLGVKLISLQEIFRCSDIVSLHTPHLKETEGMITGQLLDSMKPGSTFINTARGAVVRQDELIDLARRRPDLQFVLDVVEPEPPAPDSPLYTLKNIVLTPHIAGSVGNECRRMGRYMVEELERFAGGKPLKYRVTADAVRHSSHRPPDMPSAEQGSTSLPKRPVQVTITLPPKHVPEPLAT